MKNLEDYINESISFVKEHEPEEGYFLAFSGGKDSICLHEVCKLAGVKFEAFHSCTRIDPPEIYKFIKEFYPDVKWLFPEKTIYQLIKEKGPPSIVRRYCCDFLKKNPTKHHPLKNIVNGIRKEESKQRASRPRIDKLPNKRTSYKVIFEWPEWAVWEFIEKQELHYPTLYDEGEARIGCVWCPYILGMSHNAKHKQYNSQRRYPSLWKALKKATMVWFYQKNPSSVCNKGFNFEQWYEYYLNGFPTDKQMENYKKRMDKKWEGV